MKVAIYARVSTLEQDSGMQVAALREYCARRGWVIYREYIDQGQSGAAAARPALDELMRDAGAHKFSGVLVWKFDRLFRSVQHMLEALDRFRTLGVDFASITEAIDTTTSLGKMVFVFLAAYAEFERDLIRERTLAGMARAKANGKRIGRPRVYVDRERAAKLWNGGNGLSYRKIASELGVSPTKVFEVLQEGVLKLTHPLTEQR
jgi:DNA invertase Pin-like site-specific DNA recombinase